MLFKYSSMHFAPGGLAESLSDAFSDCSLSPLSSVFPTRPHRDTHKLNVCLSCGWRSVKSHLSSWMRTGSTKFPFLHVEPLRHRIERWCMARHVSPQTNRQWICMALRRAPPVSSVVLPQPSSDCVMTPGRTLTGFVYSLSFSSGLNKLTPWCTAVCRDTGASTQRLMHTRPG